MKLWTGQKGGKKSVFSSKWISRKRIIQCLGLFTLHGEKNGFRGILKIHKGLKQGDPLSPFLFLIVAEGLAGMVQKAVATTRFKGFEVNEAINFSILQFVDDTILMGKGSEENLWCIKSIL